MTPVERLAVALIRTLNRDRIDPAEQDRDLLSAFGQAAMPLAEGLHTAIADEVQRQLRAERGEA